MDDAEHSPMIAGRAANRKLLRIRSSAPTAAWGLRAGCHPPAGPRPLPPCGPANNAGPQYGSTPSEARLRTAVAFAFSRGAAWSSWPNHSSYWGGYQRRKAQRMPGERPVSFSGERPIRLIPGPILDDCVVLRRGLGVGDVEIFAWHEHDFAVERLGRRLVAGLLNAA